jgi:hypothetical protein
MCGPLPPPAAAPAPACASHPRPRRRRRPALAAALLLALLACLAPSCGAKGTAVNKAKHKLHRGKHHAASRHARKEALGVSLLKATGGMCHYMETAAFEETFTEELNVSRWDPRSLDGLFHCNRGTDEYVRACVVLCCRKRSGGVCACLLRVPRPCCAAIPLTRVRVCMDARCAQCTMATTANFAMNTSLPFYPNGNVSGAVLTLSQNPCNDPYRRNACCQPSHKSTEAGHYSCANWTGAPRAGKGEERRKRKARGGGGGRDGGPPRGSQRRAAAAARRADRADRAPRATR